MMTLIGDLRMHAPAYQLSVEHASTYVRPNRWRVTGGVRIVYVSYGVIRNRWGWHIESVRFHMMAGSWQHVVEVALGNIETSKRIRDRKRNQTLKGSRREHRQLMKSSESHKCAYCETILPQHEVTTDHVIPLSRGGTNERENRAICCKLCNGKKGNRLLAELPEGWFLINRSFGTH